ncbi:MAG: fused MFS/spermidine synthase, partial [Myxococcota bacterium]|nr:fused MFS/spermidine synthase [Myxococcota bacterium]
MARYASTIFCGSLLLFVVQPMMARYILPWFGGSPAVWTTSMLFFQLALLLGYAYTHLGAQLRPRTQGWLHVGLLVGSLALLPITPDERWMGAAGDPRWGVVGLLAVHLGIPFVLLSSTAPLLQRFYALTEPAGQPYRLYALSNAGSLIGLLAYPFAIERWLSRPFQTAGWSVAYAGFVALCALTTWRTLRRLEGISHAVEGTGVATEPAPTAPRDGDALLWLVLPACGSSLLLAVTNQMCQDLAVVPFLWVLPLAIYLVTFILSFDDARWYDRRVWGAGLVASALATVFVLFQSHTAILLQLGALAALLLTGCMVCHGELARLQPVSAHLTRFYVMIALGGALGGTFVGILAPRLFLGYWELHAAVLGSLLLFWSCVFRDDSLPSPRLALAARAACVLSLGAVLPTLMATIFEAHPSTIAARRSFYGVLRVYEHASTETPTFRALWHGAVRHGMQWTDAARRRVPTTYYGPESGGTLAITAHPERMARLRREPGWTPLHVGVVGLGVGTLATYGHPGDHFRFYEIDEEVLSLAREYFTFLEDSAASVEVVLGDARIRLTEELASSGSQRFDVLVLDAFSSDSVPMHLLTREAFELYAAHLEPDGVLAIHVSNRHLDFA